MKMVVLEEINETDEYGFSNKYVGRVSYRVKESDKEIQLREIENKLATKYTQTVCKDSLEGRTIKMNRVEINGQNVEASRYCIFNSNSVLKTHGEQCL